MQLDLNHHYLYSKAWFIIVWLFSLCRAPRSCNKSISTSLNMEWIFQIHLSSTSICPRKCNGVLFPARMWHEGEAVVWRWIWSSSLLVVHNICWIKSSVPSVPSHSIHPHSLTILSSQTAEQGCEWSSEHLPGVSGCTSVSLTVLISEQGGFLRPDLIIDMQCLPK